MSTTIDSMPLRRYGLSSISRTTRKTRFRQQSTARTRTGFGRIGWYQKDSNHLESGLGSLSDCRTSCPWEILDSWVEAAKLFALCDLSYVPDFALIVYFKRGKRIDLYMMHTILILTTERRLKDGYARCRGSWEPFLALIFSKPLMIGLSE